MIKVQLILDQFFKKDVEMSEDTGSTFWFVKDDFLVKVDGIEVDSAHLTEDQKSVIFYDRDADSSISADLEENVVAHVYKEVPIDTVVT